MLSFTSVSQLFQDTKVSQNTTPCTPSLWSGGFRPLALNMREHSQPLSLDTLFSPCLNQRKRVAVPCTWPCMARALLGTRRLPGQREVRHLPFSHRPTHFLRSNLAKSALDILGTQWWLGIALPCDGTAGAILAWAVAALGRCRARGSRESWVLLPRLEEQTLHGPPKATTGGVSQAGPGPPQHKKVKSNTQEG